MIIRECFREACVNIFEVNVQSNPKKYCSKSCAAKVNNVKFPKRKPEGACVICGEPTHTNLTNCKEHRNWRLGKDPEKCVRCEVADRLTYDTRCRECKNSEASPYKLERYHRKRAEYVSEWGGKCVDCGSVDELEFDHTDASSKEVDVGYLFSSSSDITIREELVKCELMCWECHRIKTTANGENGAVEHGGGASGKRGCSCELCRKRKSEYMSEYRRINGR